MMLDPTEFKDLQEHISRFAQELQDIILDCLLETQEEEIRVEEWRPPLALRVSSGTRRKYAPAYFAKTWFVIHWFDFNDWAIQLSDWHVRHIKQVGLHNMSEPGELHDEDHCSNPNDCCSRNSGFLRVFLRMQRRRQGELIREADMQHLDQVFGAILSALGCEIGNNRKWISRRADQQTGLTNLGMSPSRNICVC
ncbi:hypothetical protein CKM354_000912600 [Cercospora kikuchii]|uniref:Uncharacterized protein n=1 Tax=Cercospora kikuchii TaxID=84275 RepID=A0A9P3CR13_9PEZI|nr:uncharacterized protein CKM354_000912600 [Cercospora kikuchii]GIZ45982.1 hypothetical protein CKM354_000912600 [Cercospora kikuchii]